MAGKRSEVKSPKQTKFEGLPLVDATEDIALVIKPQDIEKSIKKDPNNCAAALAGRRELHTDVRVYLSRTYVKDEKKQRWIRFFTPMSINKEITAFDRGATFEPGEYVLKVPSEAHRLGVERRGGTNKKNPKKRKYLRSTAHVRINAKDKIERAVNKK